MSDESKKLMRSNEDRWLAGVCGGLGEYFNVDPTIFRVLFALMCIFGGGGFIAYIVLWIIMPQAPMDPTDIDISEEKSPSDVE